MNNIAISPKLCMYALQNQNVERKFAKPMTSQTQPTTNDNTNNTNNTNTNTTTSINVLPAEELTNDTNIINS